MDPPATRPQSSGSSTSSGNPSLFQVYLRLRPAHQLNSSGKTPECFLTVEPPISSSPPTQQQKQDKLAGELARSLDRASTLDEDSLATSSFIDNDDDGPNFEILSEDVDEKDRNQEQAQEQAQGQEQAQDEGQSAPTHITIHPPSQSRKRAVEKFAFTRVFEEESDQIDIFNGIGIAGVVEGVVGANSGMGRDGLVATLGVTGSGKSHTILGCKSQRGMLQLSLDLLYRSLAGNVLHPSQSPSLVPSLCATDPSEAQIFSAQTFLDNVYGVESAGRGSNWSRATTPMTSEASYVPTATPKRRFPARPNPMLQPQIPYIGGMTVPIASRTEYAIIVSMYEVYNDRIFDLLAPTVSNAAGNGRDYQANNNSRNTRKHLLFKPTEASPDRKVVTGLKKVVCGTYEEALVVLETGMTERRIAGTGSNSVSSRSHGFFVVEVKRRTRGGMSSAWTGASLTIVDLAGSERARNAKTAGATLAEAGKINESLMFLGQCLQMQSDQSQEGSKPNLVPYRQCKLTELLFSNSFPQQQHASTNQQSSAHPRYHRNPQKAIMIVTADPFGDFNATSQILRYSALAREVTVPRIPSVSSTILAGIHNGSVEQQQQQQTRSPSNGSVISQASSAITLHAAAGSASGQQSDDSMLDLALSEIARLTEEVEILQVKLSDEETRRHDAQAFLSRAEERMETLEADVRAECWTEMEAQMEGERRRWVEAWGEETDRCEGYVDRKLDILARGGNNKKGNAGVKIHEDREDQDEWVDRLEMENDSLRRKVEALEREVGGLRSPTKSQGLDRGMMTARMGMGMAIGSARMRMLGTPPPPPGRGSDLLRSQWQHDQHQQQQGPDEAEDGLYRNGEDFAPGDDDASLASLLMTTTPRGHQPQPQSQSQYSTVPKSPAQPISKSASPAPYMSTSHADRNNVVVDMNNDENNPFLPSSSPGSPSLFNKIKPMATPTKAQVNAGGEGKRVRSVRKLTARKWDLMDEEALGEFGVF